jgi:type VI secretion system protein ImpC
MSYDSRTQFHVGADVESRDAAATARADGNYRILILGDFSGRARPLDGKLSTHRVDRDDLDDAIRAIAPELSLSLDASIGPATMRFTELEDFHPDRLLGRVPLLVNLRELRDVRPSSERHRETSTPSSSGSRTDAAALSLGSGSLLDRIMEGEPDAAGTAIRGVAPQDDLSDFLRRVVKPHLANEATAEQRERAAKVDELTVATLRVLLHHPKFQALESLWRGVDFLTRRLDTDERLQIHIADVPRSALLSMNPASVVGWSLVIAEVSLGVEDLELIWQLAELALSTRTPWIAAARPDLAGVAAFGDGSDVDDWDKRPIAGWDELRRSAAARWLCLTAPRMLLRVPYGRASDPCTTLPFEEQDPNVPSHGSYLWGNGAFAAALLLGEAAAGDDPPATQGTIPGLPLHLAKIDGEPTAVPCAEALISQRSMTHLLDRGLTPLVSERDGDSVRVPRLQSVATPASPLGG